MENRQDENVNTPPLYESHIHHWMTFGDQFLHTSNMISQNIHSIAELTENKTLELSHQFQLMATASIEQNQSMQSIMHLAHTVNINGEDIEIQQISSLLQDTFISSISCILEISKQAMVMIYILDDALKTLGQIEKSIHEIEVINQKTKYLSLNATIEAVRAGEAGESFQVVASEVRELSNDTQSLATNIRSQVTEMSETLMNAQNILQHVARIDMSDNILAKERLEVMMKGLVDNTIKLSTISQGVAVSVQKSSDSARNLITSIQFQDRVQQDFQHILNDLKNLQNMAFKIKGETSRDIGEVPENYKDIFAQEIGAAMPAMRENLSQHQDRPAAADNDDITLF
jgi:methyl-accepting chemotaxis protein